MSTQVTPEGPFKVLDYYTEADALVFAGREQEIQEVVARIVTSRTLVLYGRSGLGKTSLLLAGVFPELRKRTIEPVYVRTLDAPLDDLREAIAKTFPSEALGRSTGLRGLLAPLAKERTVALVFDQFEEFFIRFRQRPEVRQAFIRELADTVSDPDLDLRVVFSLREDYLAELDDFRPQLAAIFANEYRLRPLTAFGARQAVTQPLVQAGVDFDQRFLVRLVDELAQFDFDPAILQIICSEVYREASQRTAAAPHLTELDLQNVGGADGIFRRYLDSVTRSIRPEHQLLARAVLDNFLTRENTKQATTLATLLEADFVAAEAEVQAILDLLVEQRLLRAERRKAETWYELVHERLVPVVLDWLERDRDFFEFRSARELVVNSSRNELWRRNPEALLNRGQMEGVVGPYRDRLRLGLLQVEFLFRSAVYRLTTDVLFWAERFGFEPARDLLLEQLSSSNSALRLGSVTAAVVLPDPDGRLAQSCLLASLEDTSHDVRRAAGRSLATLATSRELDQLRDRLRHRETRGTALQTLADLQASQVSAKLPFLWRWRARRIERSRILRENRDFVNAQTVVGAGTGAAAGIAWCCTIGVLTYFLLNWMSGSEPFVDIFSIIRSIFLLGLGACLGAGLGALLGSQTAAAAARKTVLGDRMNPLGVTLNAGTLATSLILGMAIFGANTNELDQAVTNAIKTALLVSLACLMQALVAALIAKTVVASVHSLSTLKKLSMSLLASLGFPYLVPVIVVVFFHVRASPYLTLSAAVLGFISSIIAISQPSTTREPIGRRLLGTAQVAAITTVAALFLGSIGFNTVPFLGDHLNMLPNSTITLKGSLNRFWPDADFFNIAVGRGAVIRVGKDLSGRFLADGEPASGGDFILTVKPTLRLSVTNALHAREMYRIDLTSLPIDPSEWILVRPNEPIFAVCVMRQNGDRWIGKIGASAVKATDNNRPLIIYIPSKMPMQENSFNATGVVSVLGTSDRPSFSELVIFTKPTTVFTKPTILGRFPPDAAAYDYFFKGRTIAGNGRGTWEAELTLSSLTGLAPGRKPPEEIRLFIMLDLPEVPLRASERTVH